MPSSKQKDTEKEVESRLTALEAAIAAVEKKVNALIEALKKERYGRNKSSS